MARSPEIKVAVSQASRIPFARFESTAQAAHYALSVIVDGIDVLPLHSTQKEAGRDNNAGKLTAPDDTILVAHVSWVDDLKHKGETDRLWFDPINCSHLIFTPHDTQTLKALARRYCVSTVCHWGSQLNTYQNPAWEMYGPTTTVGQLNNFVMNDTGHTIVPDISQ